LKRCLTLEEPSKPASTIIILTTPKQLILQFDEGSEVRGRPMLIDLKKGARDKRRGLAIENVSVRKKHPADTTCKIISGNAGHRNQQDENHRCEEFLSEQLISTEKNPFHFHQYGLSNLAIAGMKYRICHRCNAQVAQLPSGKELRDLNKKIFRSLVLKQGPLSGPEVKYLRKRCCLRLDQLAALVGKKRRELSEIESERASPSTHKLIRLAVCYASRNYDLVQLLTDGLFQRPASARSRRTPCL
jgi:DNA-binding transcriptional regulator YiaG